MSLVLLLYRLLAGIAFPEAPRRLMDLAGVQQTILLLFL